MTGGGDFSAAAPFANGLSNPVALAYWAGCGDMAVGIGEDCDTGPASVTCDEDCTAPVCGDWTLNAAAGEQCDDGNDTDGDGCTATCQKEASGSGGAGGGGGAGGNGGAGVGGAAATGRAARQQLVRHRHHRQRPVTEPVPANGAGSRRAARRLRKRARRRGRRVQLPRRGAPAIGTQAWLASAVALLATARRRRRR